MKTETYEVTVDDNGCEVTFTLEVSADEVGMVIEPIGCRAFAPITGAECTLNADATFELYAELMDEVEAELERAADW